MKKVSFDLNREEKNRILEMHQKSTGRQYLNLINENEIEEGILSKVLWTVGGAAVIGGGIAAYNWEGGDAQKSVKSLHESCETAKLGKPLQNSSEIEKIAKEIGEALREKTMGFIPTTNEDSVKSALLKIKSIPDYCKVASEYESMYGEDLYDGFEGDFSKFSQDDWDTYIRQPLTKAIKTTEKANEEGSTVGGGGEEEGSEDKDEEGKTSDEETIEYKSCSGTFGLGCKDEEGNEVWHLQACLGIKQTGKFGPNTESALKQKTGKTKIEEEDIWTLCEDESPGEIALY